MTVTTPPNETALIAALPRLRRYALVLTGLPGRADDLVLDTLALASGAHELPRHRMTFTTWLFMLMHELHVDESSRSRDCSGRTLRGVERGAADQHRIPTASPQFSTESNDTLGRLSRLAVAEREILLLVAVERLAYEEIAVLLGVPIATVMARLNRARANLSRAAGDHRMSGKNPS